MGDKILCSVGTRLKKHIEEDMFLARMGGDEFIIMLPDIKRIEVISDEAERILSIFKKPFVIDGEEFVVETSVGISVYPNDGKNAESLIQHADSALYRAKEKRDAGYQLYNINMNIQVSQHLFMEKNLRKAIDREQLKVYYQPIIQLKTGRITGAEALVRWVHPEKGLISPGEFIPFAEENGLIVPIGEYVLRKACSQAKKWQEKNLGISKLSVNLSPKQFKRLSLKDRILEIITETGIDGKQLGLEITEGTAVENPGKTLSVLRDLREEGIQILLDDFGTGYSSLNYLSRFPMDVLKIDRSFINNLKRGGENLSIVSGIIAMAHELGLKVTAEGVETEEQLKFLADHHCDYFQGYYISPPLPPAEFEEMMAEYYVRHPEAAATEEEE